MITTKQVLSIGLFVLAMIFGNAGQAVTLALEPAVQPAAPGDTVSIDLRISGLGDFAPDSISTFDIDVSFDSTALSLSSFSLGSFLGDLGFGEALDLSFGDLGFGMVNVAVVSLLEADGTSCIFCIPPYLDDIQPASFVLATFEFMVDALAPGASTEVVIDAVYALGDGFGAPLPLDGSSDADIVAPVPLPATALLLGFGLAGLGLARRRLG